VRVDRLAMPRNLVAVAGRYGREQWMAALPDLVHLIAQDWSIQLGEPFQPGGYTAWVAPVRTETGERLVLKVGWRHPEAEHEAAGLRVWAGSATVRLVASREFDDSLALLLERCTPGTPLRTRPQLEQDTVIAKILKQLWVKPGGDHCFPPLQLMCEQWADRFDKEVSVETLGIDPGLVRAGIALLRELPSTAEKSVLLCTDMHAGNVLAAERQPWLAIDPKPYLGDPTYDPLQHMLNCEERLLSDPHGLVRRMAGLLDLEVERLTMWLFARSVQQATEWPFLAKVAREVAPA